MERFVPGQRLAPMGPLASYGQSLPAQAVTTYIESLSQQGDLVVHPFADSASVCRLASHMGRSCVAAHANPLLVLLARREAAPLSAKDVDTLFRRVAGASREGATVQRYILDLYRTRCPECGWLISANSFIWDRETRLPSAKVWRCSSCGSAGEAPVDDQDLELARTYERKSLAYWRALSRLANREDAIYPRCQALLELYTGRNLHALMELTQRLETALDEGWNGTRHRDTRLAILLECLEAGASLDSPDRSHRMARLGSPSRFLERNVWNLFESACESARRRSEDLPLDFSQHIVTDMGIPVITVAGAGQLARDLSNRSAALILAAPPPPAPALWILSFMWTAWLLGKDNASHLAHWLRHHSTDWDWYVEAFGQSLQQLGTLLRPDGRMALTFKCEQERWIEAVFASIQSSRLQLVGLACQPVSTPPGSAPAAEYRIVLASRRDTHSGKRAVEPSDAAAWADRLGEAGEQGVRQALFERAEPTPGVYLHAAAYLAALRLGLLARPPDSPVSEGLLPAISSHLWTHTTRRTGLSRCASQRPSGLSPDAAHPGLEIDLWWTSRLEDTGTPLLDRLETFLADFLTTEKSVTTHQVCDAVYSRHAGLQTPTSESIVACLTSYAQQDIAGRWSIRDEDVPDRRRLEAEEIIRSVFQLGRRLGARVTRSDQSDGEHVGLCPSDVLWTLDDEQPYLFRIVWTTSSSALECDGRLMALGPRCYLVLPGGRSPLVSYRLSTCPLWAEQLHRCEWQFIKYRHIRKLTQERVIDKHSLLSIVGLDPIVERDEVQIPLF